METLMNGSENQGIIMPLNKEKDKEASALSGEGADLNLPDVYKKGEVRGNILGVLRSIDAKFRKGAEGMESGLAIAPVDPVTEKSAVTGSVPGIESADTKTPEPAALGLFAAGLLLLRRRRTA